MSTPCPWLMVSTVFLAVPVYETEASLRSVTLKKPLWYLKPLPLLAIAAFVPTVTVWLTFCVGELPALARTVLTRITAGTLQVLVKQTWSR